MASSSSVNAMGGYGRDVVLQVHLICARIDIGMDHLAAALDMPRGCLGSGL